MRPRTLTFLSIGLLAATLGACGGGGGGSSSTPPVSEPPSSIPGGTVTYTETRPACRNANPERNLYFGDLHVHTNLSLDASMWGTQRSPNDAYQYAKNRDLDFTALTDHSEFLGELQLCLDPTSPSYNTLSCQHLRAGNRSDFSTENLIIDPQRNTEVCGADGSICLDRARTVWAQIQASADKYYDDSSACTFTTFVAYEWTGSNGKVNLHRNVFFRNAHVLSLPISHFEQPTPEGLRSGLNDDCLKAAGSGCDVIAIPHNSDLGGGEMFTLDYPGATTTAQQCQQAALQAKIEPLLEIHQHKGASECLPGTPDASPDAVFTPDSCDFEQHKPAFMNDFSDVERAEDFARGPLRKGLQERLRLGVNPFHFGFVAATDTHDGKAGDVDEDNYTGHVATIDDTVEERLSQNPLGISKVEYNPGGLTAVWAVENSRDALFEALRRREVYGTSGTRIRVRVFGGWNLPETLCSDADWVNKGYTDGVPMGGQLAASPGAGASPRFVVRADKDQTALQRIEIVKGWVDSGGATHVSVNTVAGGATTGSGGASLCAVWTDSSFKAAEPAYYYVRVLEDPVQRWSKRQCDSLDPATRAATASCSDSRFYRSIQERAWSSPIWYVPANAQSQICSTP